MATGVEWMNFWLRAAPITETAIGHTSASCSVDNGHQRSLFEVILTVEGCTL